MYSDIAPKDKHQVLVRKKSIINLENLRKQYIRRRWKLSYSVVSLCNHLRRSLKNKVLDEEKIALRNCASDVEDETERRQVIQTRRRSSVS
ncbi:death-associated protein kinase 2-like [Bufo bufo]|uniref:death-associated protein kinase 2-like n=1 Tax=Bufo bufo TaxID=8384 RepID=UPI001ABEC77E|nr:death-associated protein kinase 2-like [Bufo bufo]